MFIRGQSPYREGQFVPFQGEESNQHSDLIRSAAWNSNGTALATVGDDKVVKLWLIHDGRTYHYQGETQYVSSLRVSSALGRSACSALLSFGPCLRCTGRTRRSSPASSLLPTPRVRSSSTPTRYGPSR